ncbi:unnamed protein product [Cuscuta europaea]|uniref:Uncharacterized protein n=1 Tax=Cuscuta europaea TaxID=41803 RepID=A0A9P0Z823_CUSEU|nr:unnamed protein product [Cuscuta europaea]
MKLLSVCGRGGATTVVPPPDKMRRRTRNGNRNSTAAAAAKWKPKLDAISEEGALSDSGVEGAGRFQLCKKSPSKLKDNPHTARAARVPKLSRLTEGFPYSIVVFCFL